MLRAQSTSILHSPVWLQTAVTTQVDTGDPDHTDHSILDGEALLLPVLLLTPPLTATGRGCCPTTLPLALPAGRVGGLLTKLTMEMPLPPLPLTGGATRW